LSKIKKTTYSIYTCDICNRKQTEHLSLFTLQDYGFNVICSIWETHICDQCTVEIYKTVNKLKELRT